jgi:hypothetical protein
MGPVDEVKANASDRLQGIGAAPRAKSPKRRRGGGNAASCRHLSPHTSFGNMRQIAIAIEREQTLGNNGIIVLAVSKLLDQET